MLVRPGGIEVEVRGMSPVLAGDSRVASHHSEEQRCGEPPASRESWVAGPQPGLVVLVPDPAGEWAYRRALCREAYARGWAEAWEAGRRALLEELAAEQRAQASVIGPVLAGPDHVVVDGRRYGPGGRSQFGDARPGDYPGGDVVW